MINFSRENTGEELARSNSSMEGLKLLYEAHRYALDVARDPWDFAVEIDELRALGMSHAEFRWLLCKGYLHHAREIPSDASDHRQFDNNDALRFYKRSCFRLTESGFALASGFFGDETPSTLFDLGGRSGHTETPDVRPRWDGLRHQFFVDEQLVKEFKVPSPNQETVLSAFEEEDWPVRIDDPLAPLADIDSKRRLHDTIKSLNRSQKRSLIRFMGDGTGEGVRWELTAGRNGRD